MRLGILGGTFDPPHLGHLVVAQEACRRIPLDRVLFVPASVPPHKLDAVDTPARLRLEMVRAAIEGDDRFEACALELERDGPSYTVDTLRELSAREPDAELFLLLGADQFRELSTWREPAAIAELATLVLIPRGEHDAERLIADARATLPAHARLAILDSPRIDVSSTEIRRRKAAGEPIGQLVPASVERLIEEAGLYRGDER
ncbi:MAG TPA: nicotinate-nucleotide adenylyltransferase [Candidatus Limnocylindria bacterium]|nr:nicotinate-nucleotide adenylyltransferase [Candidatus Limnocylindria bacterium]